MRRIHSLAVAGALVLPLALAGCGTTQHTTGAGHGGGGTMADHNAMGTMPEGSMPMSGTMPMDHGSMTDGSSMPGSMPGAMPDGMPGGMPGGMADSTMPMPDASMPGHSSASGGHGDNSPVPAGARTIKVTASSFLFEPKEITVASGEPIAIELVSTDILHDFQIDALGAHISANAGETAVGGFTAGAPGRYTFYCTVSGHKEAGMVGTLIVT